MTGNEIKSKDTLEFVIFCIENIAAALNKDSVQVYDSLKCRDFLYTYVAANYEALHTQDKEYNVTEIINAARSQGIDL